MMSLVDSIVLGIIQALTEFLPISSSGHLVLGQHFLHIQPPGIALEVILHMGTLLSILIYYSKDLRNLTVDFFSKSDQPSKRFVFYLIIGTIPAVIVGLGFENQIDVLFSNVSVVSYTLLFTGMVLFCTGFVKNKNSSEITLKIALLIGMAQAIAIIPGISRSGMTISVALMMGLSNQSAARFSFFLAIPALLGAGILKFKEALTLANEISVFTMIAGFISSAILGYIVIDWLIKLISRDKFWVFSIYCWSMGILIILLNAFQLI